MIMYAESIFVLQLTYSQEQYGHCLALLHLAEPKDTDLALCSDGLRTRGGKGRPRGMSTSFMGCISCRLFCH